MHAFTIVLIDPSIEEGQAVWAAEKKVRELVPEHIDFGHVGERWEGAMTGNTDDEMKHFGDLGFAERNVIKVKDIPEGVPAAIVFPDGSLETYIEVFGELGDLTAADQKWAERMQEVREKYPEYWAVGADIRI